MILPMEDKLQLEAVIVYRNELNQSDEFIDPVHTIIIDNGIHDYRFDPELIESITIRKRK